MVIYGKHPLSVFLLGETRLGVPSSLLLISLADNFPVSLFRLPVYPTLCGSSVHGILQARILEWVAILFSRGSSQARDQTRVSCIGRQILYHLSQQRSPMPLLYCPFLDPVLSLNYQSGVKNHNS